MHTYSVFCRPNADLMQRKSVRIAESLQTLCTHCAEQISVIRMQQLGGGGRGRAPTLCVATRSGGPGTPRGGPGRRSSGRRRGGPGRRSGGEAGGAAAREGEAVRLSALEGLLPAATAAPRASGMATAAPRESGIHSSLQAFDIPPHPPHLMMSIGRAGPGIGRNRSEPGVNVLHRGGPERLEVGGLG
jgi:hypothetical protein